MKNRLLTMTTALRLTALAALAGLAHAGGGDARLTTEQAKLLLRDAKVSLSEAAAIAERYGSGKAVMARCCNEHASNQQRSADANNRDDAAIVVTILVNDNQFRDVRVDARTGAATDHRTMANASVDRPAVQGAAGGDQRRDASPFSRAARWHKATDLTGKAIKNPAGESLGTLHDIVVDARSGRILYGVVSYGGFMGLGDKLFAMPWSSLRLAPDSGHLSLDVSRETLSSAEGFNQDQWPNFADERWATGNYKHYGQEPYWRQNATGDSYNDRWTSRVVVWQKSTDLCGKGVRNQSNQDLGTMTNLAIDPDNGRILYGILKREGRLFAIPYNAATLSDDGKYFIVNAGTEAFADSYAFADDRWPDLADDSWATRTHDIYRVQPYWTSPRNR